MKKVIYTDKAPAAIGPYSQAVRAGNLLFVSGQIPVNPVTNTVVEGGIEAQARQVLDNIMAILGSQGLTPGCVVKTTVFLQDMADFQIVNAVYAEYFITDAPARACVQVAKLPKDVLVEIEAIAAFGRDEQH